MHRYIVAVPIVLLGMIGVGFAAPRDVTLPAGTVLHLRLDNSVGSDISRVEEPVRADLTRPVVVRGRTVVPVHSLVLGDVTAARPAGHLRQRSEVAVRFHELKPAELDRDYRIATRSVVVTGPSLARRDAEGIGVPAVGGAIIGGIVGGAKGAGIGAAVGTAAGTTRLMVTRAKNVRLRRGALLAVRLTEPVTIPVPERLAER